MNSKYFKFTIMIFLFNININCMQFDDKSADAELYRMIGNLALAQSLSGSHSCAVMENGAVRCWGYGNRGRLGYGTEGDVMSPFVAKDIFLPAQ